MRVLLIMISLCLLLTSCEVFNSSNSNGDEETAYHFEVEFHKEHGYPTKININPSREIADEEIILEISNFSPINN